MTQPLSSARTDAPCACHGGHIDQCPTWTAFEAGMVFVQSNPTRNATDLWGIMQAAVLGLAARRMLTEPTGPRPWPQVVVDMAEQHRPQIRSELSGDAPPSWRSVRCGACNIGWYTWAPGDTPFRCSIWQRCLEEGIVSE